MKIAPFLTIITFALWWGGFTFYASWVIPTAHEVTGNHILTGMITQRVSNVLNVLTTAFIAVSMVTFYVEKRERKQWIPLSIIAGGLLVLVVLHPKMDTFVQVETQSLSDKTGLYAYHRVYLLVSTAMWLAGSVWLFFFTKRVKY